MISFHSLEDRIVKQFIAKHSRDEYDRRAPFAAPKVMKLQSLRRIKPSDEEVRGNPRSRSAIMRVAMKVCRMIRLNLVLLVAVMVSAVYLVSVQYESRRVFTELDKARSEARRLETEYERLQVEKTRPSYAGKG